MADVSVVSAERAQVIRDDERQLREEQRTQGFDESSEADRTQRLALRRETEQTEELQEELRLRLALERIAEAQPDQDLPRGSIVDIVG